MDDTNNTVPVVIYKQACMKIDSVISDLSEIKESTSCDSARNYIDCTMEILASIEVGLLNIARNGYSNDDEFNKLFIDESIDMDEIDRFPDNLIGDMDDLMENEI